MARMLDTSKPGEIIAAARRYAAADRSDPFAFNRALTHIGNGVASLAFHENGRIVEAYYNARPVTSMHSYFANGERREYAKIEYVDMVRP